MTTTTLLPTRDALVVDVADGGWTIDGGAVADPAGEVGRREPHRPRWVWDTAAAYPLLLAAGRRVERAWDLRLARAILRTATTAFDHLPPDGWDERPAEQPDGVLPLLLTDPQDGAVEYRRQLAAIAAAPKPGALRLLVSAESAGALAAAEMHHAGIPWSAAEHERILAAALGSRVPSGVRPAELELLAESIRAALDAPGLNPDSPGELLRHLRRSGIAVDSTRAAALRDVRHPVVVPLLAYKKLARLNSANGWQWLDTWVRAGRFHPDYVVGGVVTGRWATRGGGAMQLPKAIRGAVVADPGWRLVVADAAQLEPRVLAGLAGDRAMAAAGAGRDLYDGIVATGVVADREAAKYGMLGALYGATQGVGGRLVPRLAQRYPTAIGLVERAARAGERGLAVTTLLGRTSPKPSAERLRLAADAAAFDADDAVLRSASRAAREWGRFTRNFVVQGTAAEWALCWMADLRKRLWALADGDLLDRPHLVAFLHDEVVVHTPESLAPAVADAVRDAAVSAGALLFGSFPVDFPLDVSTVVHYGDAR